MFQLIHLSDLHLKNDHPSIERIKFLTKDIKEQFRDSSPYILFSGDLAYSGDQNEYDLLSEYFIEPLIDTIERFYIVPGNHDIERNKTNKDEAEKYLSDKTQSYLYKDNGIIDSNKSIYQNSDPLENYFNFSTLAQNSILQNYFGWMDENPDFDIVGFNSSWLGGFNRDGGDIEKIRIDPAIIDHFSNKISKSKLKIAMFHHPTSWFDPELKPEIERKISSEFDLALFGHEHYTQQTVEGNHFNQCRLIKSPTIFSKYSVGSNSYSIISVENQNDRHFIKINYRSFSEPRQLFITGNEIANDGVSYPSKDDADFWQGKFEKSSNALFNKFVENSNEIDIYDWYRTNFVSKNDTKGDFVEPTFKETRFDIDQKQFEKSKSIKDIVLDHKDAKRRFIIGPQDSGLTTSAFLTAKFIVKNISEIQVIPVYINIGSIPINKAKIYAEAVRTCPIRFSHTEMESLINEGRVIFIFDQIGLPEVERFNRLIDVLDSYFPNSQSILFCASDGGKNINYGASHITYNPSVDPSYEISQLKSKDMDRMIRARMPSLSEAEVNSMLNNAVACFKQMDEPIYPSTVMIVLETIEQLPGFRPINRVKLLDRYVEVILGRYDLEDVRTGYFNSNDKIGFLAYICGRLALDKIVTMKDSDWNRYCSEFEKHKMIELPSGLLEEFTAKGILFQIDKQITFRADFLFAYFLAKEMHSNSDIFRFVTNEDNFFSFHREIVFFGELEGTENLPLLEECGNKLKLISEEINSFYKYFNIDLDGEWTTLVADNDGEENEKRLTETLSTVFEEKPTEESVEAGRDETLSEVKRQRGVKQRDRAVLLEAQLLILLTIYSQLFKHSTNLSADDKILHIRNIFSAAELFTKSLSAKRGIIAKEPVSVFSGVVYYNPLAAVDPKKSISNFKYSAHLAIEGIITKNIHNPLLDPVFRSLANDENHLVRLFSQSLLLESSIDKNGMDFVNSLVSSEITVLQTCSLMRLKDKYLGDSIDENREKFFSKIVLEIDKRKSEVGASFSREKIEKERRIQRIRRNLSNRSEAS